jgi:hypothetical protein
LAVEARRVCRVQEVDKAVAKVALVAEIDREIEEVEGAAAGEGRRRQGEEGRARAGPVLAG